MSDGNTMEFQVMFLRDGTMSADNENHEEGTWGVIDSQTMYVKFGCCTYVFNFKVGESKAVLLSPENKQPTIMRASSGNKNPFTNIGS